MKSLLGNFYRHLSIFSGHTDEEAPQIVVKISDFTFGPFREKTKTGLQRTATYEGSSRKRRRNKGKNCSKKSRTKVFNEVSHEHN